jgi:hypothetical protein
MYSLVKGYPGRTESGLGFATIYCLRSYLGGGTNCTCDRSCTRLPQLRVCPFSSPTPVSNSWLKHGRNKTGSFFPNMCRHECLLPSLDNLRRVEGQKGPPETERACTLSLSHSAQTPSRASIPAWRASEHSATGHCRPPMGLEKEWSKGCSQLLLGLFPAACYLGLASRRMRLGGDGVGGEEREAREAWECGLTMGERMQTAFPSTKNDYSAGPLIRTMFLFFFVHPDRAFCSPLLCLSYPHQLQIAPLAPSSPRLSLPLQGSSRDMLTVPLSRT